jgi:hypothetical protein
MSRARRSTIEHLQKLAIGTAIVAACHGYAVVDPMPTPAKCQSNFQFKGKAVWVKSADGGPTLDLVVTLTGVDPAFASAFTASAVRPNGNIVSSVMDAQGNVVVTLSGIVPDKGGIEIVYALSCDAGADQNEFGIYWSTPPVEGRVEAISN